MNYLVVTTKSWNVDNFLKLQTLDKKNNWFLITKKEQLTLKKIKRINPRYIFFPHWSWIIPGEVFKNYECVVFHMTDLPYGRGGSPLQNLLVRNFKKTKITALRVVEALDAGDVYLKKNLILSGTAEEIFKKASGIVYQSIQEIVRRNPTPKPQFGKVVTFTRRKPEEGDITQLNKLVDVYNYIRMLTAEGYPRAFLEKNKIRLEFEYPKYKKKYIEARVIIKILE